MNVKNNRRRQASRESIEKAFVELLQTKELNQITVSELCEKTGLNRSTFYANYQDIYALADTIREDLEAEVARLYPGESSSKYYSDNWLRLFYHIRENQLFYKTYFKLGYDQGKIDLGNLGRMDWIFPQERMEYHVEFFRAGFNAIVKRWLSGGCRETPEEMSEILKGEYGGRIIS